MSSPSKIRVILIIAIVTFLLSMSALWFESVANANPRLASLTEAEWLPLILKSYPDPSPTPTATPSTQPPAIPAFDHIFIIVEENHAYSQIIGNSSAPYINSLANQQGLATNYFAIMHPSLPNYLTDLDGRE